MRETSEKKKQLKPEVSSIKELKGGFDPLVAFNPLGDAKAGVSTTLKLLISAFTLVSALAWNDAIKAVFAYIKKLFPQSEGEIAELVILVLYALIVTVITVIIINRLKKFKEDIDKDKEGQKK